MARRPGVHWPTEARTVFFDEAASAATLSKAVAEGRIRRLARRIYTADLISEADEVILKNCWKILGNFLPSALIADRSAAEDGRITHGRLFVVADTHRKSIRLPGLEVSIRPGHTYEAPDLPVADTVWAEGLRMSSAPRTLLDNLENSRQHGEGPSRTLKLAELENWLARKSIVWGGERIERLRDDAIALALALGVDERVPRILRLFDQLSGSEPVRPRAGSLLLALRSGQAWDERRLDMFERVQTQLSRTEEWAVPAELPASTETGELAFYESYFAHGTGTGTIPLHVPEELPFYESYFSNYIEGTEFSLEEARQIVDSQQPPASRPADGHDILGTYRCVADPVGRSTTSDDPDVLVELLVQRHAAIMAGRPDVQPGKWKILSNSVGTYIFVKPELVEGTLRRGFDLLRQIEPGFSRALFVLFVISEVHPFADGNGRVSRVMMNAELSRVGQSRIVIPNVFRNEYISSLRRASTENGNVEALARVLAYAWQWTATMPWSDRAAAEGQLHATNALIDSTEAQQSGRRLELLLA